MNGLARSLLVLLLATPAQADWPQWRGPTGDSVSDDKELPLAWNEKAGLAWKVAPPGWGTSTPAIAGDAIYLTSQADDKLLLMRLEKASGKLLWQKTVGTGTTPRKTESARGAQKFNDIHNLASPSPVTKGTHVVAHYGNGLLVCYDAAGKQVWQRNLATDYGPYTIWWGHANSPVLYKDLVISVCMQDSLADLPAHAAKPAKSYIVAHDLATGRVKWHVPRKTEAKSEECDSYTTPILHDSGSGPQLIVMGGNQLDAYSPATGKMIWRLPKLVGGRTVTGPTAAGNIVFATIGMRGPMLAVKLGATGDLTRQEAIWEHRKGTPDTCCPVIWDGMVFTVTDDGVARCFDAGVGALKWEKRVKGQYKASPVAADGRLYLLNTTGLCTVVAARARFEKLTENQLEDETVASPAISESRIYIRGKKALYSISR